LGMLLLQLGADLLREAAAGGRAVAQAVDPPQQVTGGGERGQAPQQGDDRGQRRAPVAVQPQVAVVGAVPPAASAAVVVGAAMAERAVKAEDVVGPPADEVGVALAVWADGAGAYVALFFRSSRPACWAEAATCCPRSRSRASTERKISWSGASAKVLAICSSRGAAAACNCASRRRRRWSRVSAPCGGGEGSISAGVNTMALLGLRQRDRTDFQPPGQGSDGRGFSHHFPEPLPSHLSPFVFP
jgi:hypothetical protein